MGSFKPQSRSFRVLRIRCLTIDGTLGLNGMRRSRRSQSAPLSGPENLAPTDAGGYEVQGFVNKTRAEGQSQILCHLPGFFRHMDIAMITISNNMPAPAEFEDDANLVARTLAGNQDAFERIVSRYQSLICSLAYSSTGNVA